MRILSKNLRDMHFTSLALFPCPKGGKDCAGPTLTGNDALRATSRHRCLQSGLEARAILPEPVAMTHEPLAMTHEPVS